MKKTKVEDENVAKAKEFKKALDYIVKEKGIDEDVVIEAMQTALSTAFKKNEKADYTSRVLIDRNTGEIKVFKVTTIVDDYKDDDDDIEINTDLPPQKPTPPPTTNTSSNPFTHYNSFPSPPPNFNMNNQMMENYLNSMVRNIINIYNVV